MANAFFLRWNLDQPCVPLERSEEISVLVRLEPNPAAAAAGQVALPAHLILLVDVSGSMDFLMRFDPDAQSVGEGLTEGKASQQVASLVPSRREVACSVVKQLVERMGPDDRLTLVAFDDQAHVLAQGLARTELGDAVRRLAEVGGGGTALGTGLQAVRDFLAAAPEPGRTRKLVVLTDGEDQYPRLALAQAQAIGRDQSVPIVAFGTGECKIAFLTDLAKTTLAGAFNHIRTEIDAEQFFQQVWAGQKNVQATGAVLTLWLSPEVYVREFYRTRPEILYIGDLQPDENNRVLLRLEQVERGKAYEFLFRCVVPRREDAQRFRLAKVTLAYDLPGQLLLQETVETNVVVEYTADPDRACARRGDVCRVLARAEVQRQVLYLQEKVDALRRGEAADHDRTLIANLLQALLKKFEEFGDRAMANHYQQLQHEFTRTGVISQEMLNRSLAASSRAEDVIVAQDIDF